LVRKEDDTLFRPPFDRYYQLLLRHLNQDIRQLKEDYQ